MGRMIRRNIIQKRTDNRCKLVSTINAGKTEMPMRAKALFIDRENQLNRPATVPAAGPRLRTTVKQSPPALGIAVVISAILSMPGIESSPANR